MWPSLLASLMFLGAALVECYPALEERAACNKDNLLNSFTNPTRSAEASSFCSAYISVPLTSYAVDHGGKTCTLSTWSWSLYTLHPAFLWNIQRQSTLLPSLVYNSATPTPSPVPGGDWQGYGFPGYKQKRDTEDQDTLSQNASNEEKPAVAEAVGAEHPMITPSPTMPLPAHDLLRRASTVPLPSWLATTYPPSRISSACSCISPSASTTITQTYPDYTQVTTGTCPYYSTSPTTTYPAFCAPTGQINAVAPSSGPGFRASGNIPVANKIECCTLCAKYFNCIWWRFDFGTKGDGWAPGTCRFGYNIASRKDGYSPGELPAICPNGLVKGLNADPYQKVGHDSINSPGYNFGPCGGTIYLWQSDEEFGYPDHPENNCNPDQYVGDCGQWSRRHLSH